MDYSIYEIVRDLSMGLFEDRPDGATLSIFPLDFTQGLEDPERLRP